MEDRPARPGPLVAICFNLAARPLPVAGLHPEKYFGHSLRARLAIATGDLIAVSADLMRRTRRKSTEAALGYLRLIDQRANLHIDIVSVISD